MQSDSYGSAFARLASGQVDILCTYADARRDYEDEWTTEYGMTNSIWDDTAVVGVTPAIYNDTISVSKTSPIMDDDFKQALGQPLITSAIPRKAKRSSPSTATTAISGRSPRTTTLSGRSGDDPVSEQRGLNSIKHEPQMREGGRGFPPSFGIGRVIMIEFKEVEKRYPNGFEA